MEHSRRAHVSSRLGLRVIPSHPISVPHMHCHTLHSCGVVLVYMTYASHHITPFHIIFLLYHILISFYTIPYTSYIISHHIPISYPIPLTHHIITIHIIIYLYLLYSTSIYYTNIITTHQYNTHITSHHIYALHHTVPISPSSSPTHSMAHDVVMVHV